MTTPTTTELEALTLFLAERKELWDIHARGFGVAAPDRVPLWLSETYAGTVKRAVSRRSVLKADGDAQDRAARQPLNP